MSAKALGKLILLLSSKITALKRRNSAKGTSWAACTTWLHASSNMACKNLAACGVKRLSTAVSVTSTSAVAAVEASCSRLASGCCCQPNTNVCNKLAPLNLRWRCTQPVSRAMASARSSNTCTNCSLRYATLLIIRLLSALRRMFQIFSYHRRSSLLLSFPFSPQNSAILKLVRIGDHKGPPPASSPRSPLRYNEAIRHRPCIVGAGEDVDGGMGPLWLPVIAHHRLS